MRRISALILSLAAAVLLTGCAELIDTQTETVDAVIVETRFYPGYPYKVGNVQCFQPPRYYTIVRYNDIIEDFYGHEIYSIAHGKNGDTIQCNLITETYDDGTVKQYLEWRK